MTVDVVDQLLEVERVSLRPLEHELDQLGGGADRLAEQLLQLGPQHQVGVARGELGEAELLEVGDSFEPEPSAGLVRRPVGQHEQHRQRRGREDQFFEEVAGERVDPVAVLEDDGQRAVGGACSKHVDQQ